MRPKHRNRKPTVVMRFEEPRDELLTALLLHADKRPCFDSSGTTVHGKSEFDAATSVNSRRSTQREQLHALRQEVSALGQHLQQLSESKELQLSLDRLLNESTVSAMSWRGAATRERHARANAEENKAELTRRISMNMSFLENVKQLLLTQAAREIIGRPSLCLPIRGEPIVLHNEDLQVYQALQSSLDHRCHQLDAILQQCGSFRCETTEDKHEICIHANGRGVEVREIDVQPFGTATIVDAMQQHVESQANACWHKDEDIYVKRILALGEFCSDGRPLNVLNRSVMRRLVHRNQTITLWESVIECDTDQARELEATTLRQKGWMVLRPLEGLGASVSQKEISIQLLAPDGSVLSPNVMTVLEPLRRFGRRQKQIIENRILDATVKNS